MVRDDNVAMTINLSNPSTDCVVATYGFGERPFHLYLVIVGPDGRPVPRNATPAMAKEPPPPLIDPGVTDSQGVYVQIENVQEVPGGSAISIPIANIRAIYPMTKPGRYQAKFVLPARFYQRVDYRVPLEDGSGAEALYASLANVSFEGAVTSNAVWFSLTGDADCDGAFFPDACPSCPKDPACPSAPASKPLADCNDGNDTVYPGATEIPDSLDNNCDGVIDEGFTTPTPKSRIEVDAERLVFGDSSKYPSFTSTPLAGLPVKVVDAGSGSCASRFGYAWQNYAAIWVSCPSVAYGYTTAQGTIDFTVDPGRYMVIAYSAGEDNVYVAGKTGKIQANQGEPVHLEVLRTADGRTVGGHAVRDDEHSDRHDDHRGRYEDQAMLLIEPDYLDGRGTTQVLLPLVLRSLKGDWSVRTKLHDHEEYNANARELGVKVSQGASAAYQFLLNRVRDSHGHGDHGWETVKLDHTTVHKGKKELIKSRIPVRDQ